MSVPALMNNGFNQLARVDGTTSPLGASATYTSPNVLNVGGNARIVGTVFANQTGTLYVDFSSDGTNWDGVSASTAVTASTATSFSVEVTAPYARLRYVNGATAQTTFRLYAFTRGV